MENTKLKGVSYDAGSVMYFNWRPDFDPKTVSREIEIIKNDLHCNSIRITGLDINRLIVATAIALKQGLEVWLCPTMWNKKQDQTQAYTQRVAEAAEKLRREYPEGLVLVVGGELTLFMNGIVEGKNVVERMTKLMIKYKQQENSARKTNSVDAISRIQNGGHNKILRAYLQKTVASVKQVFHGKIAYDSLLWESVDWNLFDYVAVDHYRAERIKDQYAEMLKPAFDIGKPVVVTEFGMPTYQGAEINGAGLGGNILDNKSQALHYLLPLFGKFIRPKLKDGNHIRDEELQARELEDQLSVLDKAGVYGAFVSVFVSQIHPYDENPRYDLDMASMSLVKSYSNGRHGVTYPDMNWEPKESFRAVADYYLKH
ncbi:MAG TPA: hypothetical protein VFF30_13510 [Nitrososphaerales archaeon]|nr:hypothetical protein [Nitrososphaerales archaeon]